MYFIYAFIYMHLYIHIYTYIQVYAWQKKKKSFLKPKEIFVFLTPFETKLN